ncbi:MAG: hypothetical protein QOH43_4818 [Solirubrobacteraceae bacterium]|jgi:hypothetical protein|nr:hypothetical protein [Solirubrobacteraceae bacterium]
MSTETTRPPGATAVRGHDDHGTARRLSTETKHSSKTSELYAYAAATVGVLVAGLVTKGGDGADDRLTADQVWLFVAILTIGYMLSRGLAKSGVRDPYTSDDR